MRTIEAGDGPAISIQGLVKSFGAVRALDGVDLEAAQGTVLGVLGLNGAGKTTTVRILATLLGNAGHWVTMTYLGAFLAERHGYTTQQIGLVYLVPGGALVIGYAVAAGRVTTLPLRPLGITTRTLVGASLAGVMVLPIPTLAGVGLLGVRLLVELLVEDRVGVVHLSRFDGLHSVRVHRHPSLLVVTLRVAVSCLVSCGLGAVSPLSGLSQGHRPPLRW